MHVSNALGGVNPVTEIAEAAHAVGAKVLVDGCQSVPNMPVDVQVFVRACMVFFLFLSCRPRFLLIG